ncbi:hypothetical protein AHAS_Ahas16G0199400 [Arachis hypogaea]
MLHIHRRLLCRCCSILLFPGSIVLCSVAIIWFAIALTITCLVFLIFLSCQSLLSLFGIAVLIRNHRCHCRCFPRRTEVTATVPAVLAIVNWKKKGIATFKFDGFD